MTHNVFGESLTSLNFNLSQYDLNFLELMWWIYTGGYVHVTVLIFSGTRHITNDDANIHKFY